MERKHGELEPALEQGEHLFCIIIALSQVDLAQVGTDGS